MADNNPDKPTLRTHGHHGDKLTTKFVAKTGELQEKAQKQLRKDSDNSEPAGGYDATPVPSAPPGYTLRITFHRAKHLPCSDLNTLSSDPYVHAVLKTSLAKRHKQDNDLVLRTPTIHRNVNPVWETQWIIAHVPSSGFYLKCRLYDEDPADHDDRLGNVHINVDHIDGNWKGFHEKSFDLKKRMGSKRAYTIRGAAALLSKHIKMSGSLIVSVENLGQSPGDNGGRAYTVAPLAWSRHHSPLIGMIAGTKHREEAKDGKKAVERYNFQAFQIQLRGPVPAELYHRYVEFKPFVAGMFTDVSFRGRVLNRALHHQHARIYNYDRTTIYGIFEKPCIELTKQLLEFVHYDEGGRIFTYVITSDGQWRFTETGKEFGIDMLSKHTMHSDVSIYIAFSGEFFVRRLKYPHRQNENRSDEIGGELLPPSAEEEEPERRSSSAFPPQHHSHAHAVKDPAYYELIIDNDSGTYRPNADLLPVLRNYVSENFPGLRIVTLDCQKDAEKMGKLKDEQRQRKKSSGKNIMYLQNSSASSLSSSDEDKLNARIEGREKRQKYKKKGAKLKPGKESSSESSSTTDGDTDFVQNPASETTEDGDKQKEGYPSKELPYLIKGDGHEQTHPEGEPDKGDNKPAGGIAYQRVVSTAT